MAAPAFGSAGSVFGVDAGTTINVDIPDNVAADDIIIVAAYLEPGGTVTGFPTGFAQAPDSPQDVSIGVGFAHRVNVMWKRATGADSTAGTYDFTLSASTFRTAQAFRYTGAITSGDPWDVTRSEEHGTTNSATTPEVSDTTTVVDTRLIFFGTNGNGGTWTPPSGFTERGQVSFGVGEFADKEQASAGATGSVIATCSSSDKTGAWLGALKSPAVGGGPELMPRAVIVVG